MKLKLKLTTKRKRLLATWLEGAMLRNAIPDRHRDCFYDMSGPDSKEVKEILDDIYTFCKAGEGNETVLVKD